MRCPACDAPNPAEAVKCRECGARMAGVAPQAPPEEGVRVRRRGAGAPSSGVRRTARPVRPRSNDGAISTIIPYKNLRALAGYYLGWLCLIPLIGLPLAPVALILGVLGLNYRRAHPEAKGTAHAIFAIICGAVSVLICQPIGVWAFVTQWLPRLRGG